MGAIARQHALVLLVLAAPLAAAAQERILLYFNDRPPYQVAAPDGSATGLTATPVAQAFKATGLPALWIRMPTNRQLLNIRRNEAMACGIGWFKRPEREAFAKFTKAIYRDRPTVALARRGYTLREGTRLDELLAASGSSLRILAKDNYSYGPYIDGLLAQHKPTLVYTTGENAAMLEMVRLQRADFMFVAEEEAHYLTEEAGAGAAEFHQLRFADMPPGEKRYLMCSRQVPDEMIARLNAAIAFE